jgi:ParB family transcriptional regulator, chromosome partitioning protein
MSAKEIGPRLGRGLAALLGDVAVQAPLSAGSVRHLALDQLEPNPFQPRSTIDLGALDELAQSIRARGILQPLLVRPHPTDPERFQIIAGERRWRAAGAAGLHEVPTLVRELTDADAAAVALIENLQRQDLNAIDEAEGYGRLIGQFGLTQDAVGQAIGKSRSHVSNTLRLLNLPPTVKEALRSGIISAGHARALLAHTEPETAMREVLDRHLSVRQTEALAARRPTQEVSLPASTERSPDIAAVERRLAERLGLRVRITFDGSGGTVQIRYTDLDQLDIVLNSILQDQYRVK